MLAVVKTQLQLWLGSCDESIGILLPRLDATSVALEDLVVCN